MLARLLLASVLSVLSVPVVHRATLLNIGGTPLTVGDEVMAVSTTGQYSGLSVQNFNAANGNGPGVMFVRSRSGVTGTTQAVHEGDDVGDLNFYAVAGDDTTVTAVGELAFNVSRVAGQTVTAEYQWWSRDQNGNFTKKMILAPTTGVLTLPFYGSGGGQVTVGAPDSCGAGFRCLRVPN